jgi:hypothetical protein
VDPIIFPTYEINSVGYPSSFDYGRPYAWAEKPGKDIIKLINIKENQVVVTDHVRSKHGH